MIYLALNDTFRFGAHAIILNSNGQVLLLKRTYGDKGWSFPGGSVEPGETIHQALYRECLEELGTEVRDVVLTGFIITVNIIRKQRFFAVQFLRKWKLHLIMNTPNLGGCIYQN